MNKTLTILISLSILISSNSYAMSVTFINPGKQGERFWDMVTETMKASAEDFNISLEVIYAERNRIKMAELGKQVTSRQYPPDYLILVNEEQAAEQIFLSTKGKSIKTLMLLNDFLPKQRDQVGYPSTKNPNLLGALIPDNFNAGRRMMSALHQCTQSISAAKKHHILAIGGDQLTPASIERNNGAISVINEQSALVLDRFLYANWNQKEAATATDKYLQWAKRNKVQPSAIWAANDPIAFGVQESLKKHKLKPGKEVCLVGLNWSSQGLEMVKKGEMLLTDGGHFLAGAWSMVLLHDFHTRSQKGALLPFGTIPFQMQSIDKNNIDQYLSYLGDEQWEKINFRGFSLSDKQGYQDYNFSLNNVFKQINNNTPLN